LSKRAACTGREKLWKYRVGLWHANGKRHHVKVCTTLHGHAECSE
jgi:hypothetical protein